MMLMSSLRFRAAVGEGADEVGVQQRPPAWGMQPRWDGVISTSLGALFKVIPWCLLGTLVRYPLVRVRHFGGLDNWFCFC